MRLTSLYQQQSLYEAGQSLYDNVPGKTIAPFNSKVAPPSPLLKLGPTVPSVIPNSVSNPIHKAVSTTSTVNSAGMPITESYQAIPALKIYERKQRNACFNCRSDLPTRHYYLQCQQLCQFNKCQQSHQPSHWGNSCPQIAQYLLQRKETAAQKRVTKEEFAMAAQQTEPMEQYSVPKIKGYTNTILHLMIQVCQRYS